MAIGPNGLAQLELDEMGNGPNGYWSKCQLDGIT